MSLAEKLRKYVEELRDSKRAVIGYAQQYSGTGGQKAAAACQGKAEAYEHVIMKLETFLKEEPNG